MSRRKEIFKDAGIYTVSSYIAQFLDIFTGILSRRFLGPANMGIWSFLQVILNYAKHSALGVTMATARDVPYFREKGDAARVEETKNLVFTFTLATSLLCSLGVAGYAFWERPRLSPAIFTGLLAVAVLVLLQRMYNLYVVLLRAHKQFAFVGVLNIFSSVLGLLLTAGLTWRFQLYGFYAATLLNYLLILIYIQRRSGQRFSFRFNLKPMLPLLSFGFAVLVSDILRTVFTSMDRIIITKYLGFEELGLYSIALMASNYLYSLPNMIGIVFFPHFQEVFAKRDNSADLEKFLTGPTFCLAYLFPLLIGTLWIFSPLFVSRVLPEYLRGTRAMQVLSLASFFWALTHAFSLFMVTVRRHWHLVPLNGLLAGLAWLTMTFFIKSGWGIEGIAVSGILLAAIYFFALSLMALVQIYDKAKILKFYFKIALIFIYLSAALLLLDIFFGRAAGLLLAVKYSVFLLVISPLLFLAEKEQQIFSTLRGLAAERLSRKKREPHAAA